MTAFFGHLFYHMVTPTEGLAIGALDGKVYKLMRIWRRTDGDLVHYAIAIFPSLQHALLMTEFLEDYYQLTSDKLTKLN